MPTRNISLTAEQDMFVEEMVRSGTYQNASEMVRDALRGLRQRHREDALRLEALREAARIGGAALDGGDHKDFATVEDLRAHLPRHLGKASVRRRGVERVAGGSWRVRLGGEAERDFAHILTWTAAMFGPDQARRYRDRPLQAISALNGAPAAPGSRARNEIMPGLRTLSVAGRGRRASHALLYRAGQGTTIEIVRILHAAMDVPRHPPPESDE